MDNKITNKIIKSLGIIFSFPREKRDEILISYYSPKSNDSKIISIRPVDLKNNLQETCAE